ncbi:hypothetical protein JCM11251_007823 [Rhodosporidiobolus azoricus]
MSRRKVDKLAPLPSLYTSNALTVPPISSHFDPKAPSLAARQDLQQLVSLTERGGAGTFLHSVLQESYAREVKRRKVALRKQDLEGPEEDEDERQLREKGFVHKKRRRTRSTSAAAAAAGLEVDREPTTGLEGDDEEGSETAAGEGSGPEEGAGNKRRRRSRKEGIKLMGKIREGLKIPDIAVAEVQLPPDFPSDDLLNSLHSQTSSLLRASHNLLPHLTRSFPLLPDEVCAHFDSLSARYNAEEERAGLEGTARSFGMWKKTRVQRSGVGMRKGVFTDAAGAFEGSALVAMGLLAKLLAEDVVQQAASSPASSQRQAAVEAVTPSAAGQMAS